MINNNLSNSSNNTFLQFNFNLNLNLYFCKTCSGTDSIKKIWDFVVSISMEPSYAENLMKLGQGFFF